MANDAVIKERTARIECDKSSLEHGFLVSSEDIGEVVQRAGPLSDTMNFEGQHSKELTSDARHSENDMLDIESPKVSTSTSRRPRLLNKTLEKAKNEERVLLDHTKGGSNDNLNAIDRLFSGLI